ncbi:MAG TPA: PIN domain-containing protein [Methylomirabilota bacterium]|jgi:uncharacterized protein YacL|nr:PIN domain-containing protein [Methylomirabilota bacterium]
MSLAIARGLLLVACVAAGAALASSAGLTIASGALAGGAAGVVAIAVEIVAGALPLRPLLWIAGGAASGLLIGTALGAALAALMPGGAAPMVRGGVALITAWLGGVIAARRAGELTRPAPEPSVARVLDTSVLIDGRVADLADAGFLDGLVIVPSFVVAELQRLADSGDGLRRNRGRRGFDVLDRLRRHPAVSLELAGSAQAEAGDVDGKLVALARARSARLLTNDTALARVAGLAGVAVASLNDLAGALRPVALPGEAMQVTIVREGKEAGQGVAYLDDGTMVVVEGGKRYIGQSLDVVVTSALQTSAGRMIFTRPRGEDGGRDA